MIPETELKSVAEAVKEEGMSTVLVSQLRKKFPDRHFTYCTEDDINSGKPVYQADDFMIYLVDANEHCLHLTNDFESATGYVVAEIFTD